MNRRISGIGEAGRKPPSGLSAMGNHMQCGQGSFRETQDGTIRALQKPLNSCMPDLYRLLFGAQGTVNVFLLFRRNIGELDKGF